MFMSLLHILFHQQNVSLYNKTALLIVSKNCLGKQLPTRFQVVRWPCRMTLTWSPYGIVLHFLLKMSKWTPKSQTCPSQVLGKTFYDPLKMRYVKNRKNPKSFVKNDQNPFLFVLVGKEIVCTLQKYCWILFPPMKVKIYNRKTEIYSFCRKRPVANRFSKK